MEDLEILSGCTGGSIGLETFGAIDSRRDLDNAAVALGFDCGGDCTGTEISGELAGVGVVHVILGETGTLDSLKYILVVFGVVGPAGASGT